MTQNKTVSVKQMHDNINYFVQEERNKFADWLEDMYEQLILQYSELEVMDIGREFRKKIKELRGSSKK